MGTFCHESVRKGSENTGGKRVSSEDSTRATFCNTHYNPHGSVTITPTSSGESSYIIFLDINEQIGQDSALARNNILKSPKLAYAIIRINVRRKA